MPARRALLGSLARSLRGLHVLCMPLVRIRRMPRSAVAYAYVNSAHELVLINAQRCGRRSRAAQRVTLVDSAVRLFAHL